MKRGFTLIEAVVYIGLFAFILGGTLASVWEVLQGQGKVDTRTTVQDEVSFVIHKLDWALGSIDPTQATTPAAGTTNTLALTRYGGTQIAVRRVVVGGKGLLQMSEDGGATYTAITTSNVDASALQFKYLPPTGTGPWGISATVTISGIVASTAKYIRK
jgi:hypothetical protein